MVRATSCKLRVAQGILWASAFLCWVLNAAETLVYSAHGHTGFEVPTNRGGRQTIDRVRHLQTQFEAVLVRDGKRYIAAFNVPAVAMTPILCQEPDWHVCHTELP
jgi:hypothetical protein